MQRTAGLQANCLTGHIDVWVNNSGILTAAEFDNTIIEIHEKCDPHKSSVLYIWCPCRFTIPVKAAAGQNY